MSGECDIPPGYKRTEAGIVPQDWDVRSLLDVVDFTNGKPHEQDIAANGRYRLVTLDSIDINGDLKNEHRLTDVWDNSLRRGDLVAVLSDLAHGNLLGLCDVVPSDGAYVLNQRMARLRPKANDDPLFIKLQINRRQRHFKARGQGTSQRHIYKRAFGALRIPVPPLNEQRAIADALGDVDALLDALDRQIAKQRDLKQAAMQQLLTGRTRLPGCTGEWRVRRIGDITSIRNGGTPSTGDKRFWDGDIPWCTPTDITALAGHKHLERTERTITNEGLAASSAELIPERSIIMTSRATIGECAVNALPVATNQGFKNLIPSDAIDTDFLYYLLGTQKQQLIRLCGGSTFLELSKTQLAAYELYVPTTTAEQTAITAVLSDMDAEIAALEARRAKSRDLKQAMLQELLTGRTRLV